MVNNELPQANNQEDQYSILDIVTVVPVAKYMLKGLVEFGKQFYTAEVQ